MVVFGRKRAICNTNCPINICSHIAKPMICIQRNIKWRLKKEGAEKGKQPKQGREALFEKQKEKKYYLDSSYRDLRKSLESIIRGNLTLTNNVVIAETTVLKRGKCTCLQSRSYSFNLEEYFKRIKGECNSNRNNQYCRYAG